jgi:hypothetical protein
MHMLARSLDGGETWTIEDPAVIHTGSKLWPRICGAGAAISDSAKRRTC